MKFLFDLFPLILFFAAFKFADIFVATAVAIAATFVQIGWTWFRYRKVETMLWVSLAVITFFGGLTLLLHDENFIKWKPTVLYWAFALGLTVSIEKVAQHVDRQAIWLAIFERHKYHFIAAGRFTVP